MLAVVGLLLAGAMVVVSPGREALAGVNGAPPFCNDEPVQIVLQPGQSFNGTSKK